MSTLKVNTIKDTSGGATTLVSATNTAKAWVNFNGTGTPAIREAYNVSSIGDNGAGDYRINFTTAMPDTNYCITGNASSDNNYPTAPTVSGVLHINASRTSPYKSQPTTTYCTVVSGPSAQLSAGFDAEYLCVVIFG